MNHRLLFLLLTTLSGCATISYRSHEKTEEPVQKVEKKFTAVMNTDFQTDQELYGFFHRTVPFKEVLADESAKNWSATKPQAFSDLDLYQTSVKPNYRLRVVLNRNIHHNVMSWVGLATALILPAYEGYSYEIAAKLENLKTGRETQYLASGRVDVWISILPIFLEFMWSISDAEKDVLKGLILGIHKDILEDLKNGKI